LRKPCISPSESDSCEQYHQARRGPEALPSSPTALGRDIHLGILHAMMHITFRADARNPQRSTCSYSEIEPTSYRLTAAPVA
jgi:hypothetical protein